MKIIKPLSENPRLDHGPMYVSVMIGLMLVSLSLLITGPIPTSVIAELNTTTQNMLACVIFIGSVMCLIGAASATKYFRPNADIRSALGLGVGGSIPVAAAIEVYFIAIVAGASSPILSGLSAGISLMIPFGSALNGWLFLRKRAYITEEMAKRIANGETNDFPGLD
jgi:hypothetical protein